MMNWEEREAGCARFEYRNSASIRVRASGCRATRVATGSTCGLSMDADSLA